MGTNSPTFSRGRLSGPMIMSWPYMNTEPDSVWQSFCSSTDMLQLLRVTWYQVKLRIAGLPGVLQARAVHAWPEVVPTSQKDPGKLVATILTTLRLWWWWRCWPQKRPHNNDYDETMVRMMMTMMMMMMLMIKKITTVTATDKVYLKSTSF